MATMSYMPDMAGYKKSCRSRHVLKPYFVMFQLRVTGKPDNSGFYQYDLDSNQPGQAQNNEFTQTIFSFSLSNA